MEPEARADTYHRKNLKRTLMRAVRAELREHGPDFISLRRIAARAGVSHAAPYRHFRGKDGMLAALCWEGQAEFAACLKKARDDGKSPADRLLRLGTAYLEFAERNPDVFRLMFSETGKRAMHEHHPDDMMKSPSDYDSFGVLESAVRECQGVKALDPREDSGALAILIWSFIHGFAHIRQEGFASHLGAVRGLDRETTERMVMRAFRGLILGDAGRR